MEEPFIPLGEITIIGLLVLYGYWKTKREKGRERTSLTRPFKKGEK